MKKLAIIILIFLTACTAIKKNDIQISESDFNQAKLAFAELEEILKRDNGNLWNYQLNGPLLLIDSKTRTIIANEGDKHKVLKKAGKFYIGKFPKNMNIANSVIEWAGKRWTMAALPLPDTKQKRMDLLVHESFHRIQPLIGFDSLSQEQCTHLDTQEGRIYMKLELEALKKALNSKNSEKHIKNALLFRQYRYQLFPESQKRENSLELLEGLAEYTGSILCGMTNSELKAHYASKIDWFYESPTFVRSFPYFTIPVYGYFMQKTDPKWNLKITQKSNLTDFIMNFCNLSLLEINGEEIKKTGSLYNMDSIVTVEIKREEKRLAVIKKYTDKFTGGKILSIKLKKMNIGFNPMNITPLDSLGTVYPNCRITDNWGVLKVDSLGALMSPGFDNVSISAPEKITDTIITGKGWTLKLNKLWAIEEKNGVYTLIKKMKKTEN